MQINRLYLIGTLTSVLVSCADFSADQPPAPVYGNDVTIYEPVPERQIPNVVTSEPIMQQPVEIVHIKPLKEFTPPSATLEELKPEPLTPEQQALASSNPPEQLTQPAQNVTTPELGTLVPEQKSASTEPASATSKQDAKTANTNQGVAPGVSNPEPVVAPPPPPPPPPPPFEPLETFAPLSPAVNVLALAATQNSKSGNIESATTTIERAIRIEPRNATLYYKLALLRLKQSKPRLAEDLAKKAALLASNDTQLKRHSWLLVARAREVQGDVKGGKEARAKAKKF